MMELQGNITRETIRRADPEKFYLCIGAITLRAALMKTDLLVDALNTKWGRKFGSHFTEDKQIIMFTTKEGVDLSKITEPQEVTFIEYEGKRTSEEMCYDDFSATRWFNNDYYELIQKEHEGPI